MNWIVEADHESGRYRPRYFAVYAETESEAYTIASSVVGASGWEINDLWSERDGPSLADLGQ